MASDIIWIDNSCDKKNNFKLVQYISNDEFVIEAS